MVFVRINGELRYLRRAIDHEGEGLESFVAKRRDRKAAVKILRKTMKIIGTAGRQETGRWKNNGAGNSHQPFRRRARAMAKFRSAQSLQKFIPIHASVYNRFNRERHLHSRRNFNLNRSAAFAEWREPAT